MHIFRVRVPLRLNVLEVNLVLVVLGDFVESGDKRAHQIVLKDVIIGRELDRLRDRELESKFIEGFDKLREPSCAVFLGVRLAVERVVELNLARKLRVLNGLLEKLREFDAAHESTVRGVNTGDIVNNQDDVGKAPELVARLI